MDIELLLIVGIIVSVLLNALIIIVLLSKGKHINYMDIIIMSLATSDILQAGVGYAIEIVAFSTVNTRPTSYFRLSTTLMTSPRPSLAQLTPRTVDSNDLDSHCKASAFAVTVFAITSTFHLGAISIERRFILMHPMKARIWLRKKMCALYVVLPSWTCAFFWALCPLLGWGSYVRERNREIHRCSINIPGTDANHLSYSYSLLVCCYILPVSVMGYCCNDIRIALKHLHCQGVRLGIPDEVMNLRKKMERRLTFMTIAMIVTFLCAWTPYAICLMIITVGKQVPSSLFSFASIFAKLSTLYNPVVYIIFMKDFRTRFRKLFQLKPTGFPPKDESALESLQRRALKIMLDVTSNSPNDIYNNVGYKALKPMTFKRQKFFKRVMSGCECKQESPVVKMYNDGHNSNAVFLRNFRKSTYELKTHV